MKVSYSWIGIRVILLLPLFALLLVPIDYFDGLPGWLSTFAYPPAFFITFISFFSLLNDGIKAVFPKATIEEARAWELHRMRGKSRFVWTFNLAAAGPVSLFLGFLIYEPARQTGYSAPLYIFLCFVAIVVFVALIGIGRATWDHFERRHGEAIESVETTQAGQETAPDT